LEAILWILLVVAVLFLIIQFVALVMGLALARSITSSIHELFAGTERVRHGDFSHRITVKSNDQLGELAGSFNQMIGSIENLLQTAAEKKRLEEELRIARQIQMSLLPRGQLDVPGLSVTALCVPARAGGAHRVPCLRRHIAKGRVGGVEDAAPEPPLTEECLINGCHQRGCRHDGYHRHYHAQGQ
jgi:HAMP domain-containing protein